MRIIKKKGTNKNWKELHKLSVIIGSLFLYYVSYMTIFQFQQVLLLFSEKYSSTKLPGLTGHFPFKRTWHLSSTRDKEQGTTWLQWEGDSCTLTYGWWDSYAFPQGWISYCGFFLATFMISLLLQTKHATSKKHQYWHYFILCMKIVGNLFPTEIVEDVCPLPEAG